MKNTVRNLLVAGIAGVSLVGAAVAFAGGPGCGGFGGPAGYSNYGPGMMGHGPGMMGRAAYAPEDMAGYQLDALKRSLKLQPGQEQPWANFAAAVETQAKRMGEFRDQAWAGNARTVPERMDQANKFAKEREQAFDTVGKAMKGLYEVLSPEQRRLLDRQGPWFHG